MKILYERHLTRKDLEKSGDARTSIFSSERCEFQLVLSLAVCWRPRGSISLFRSPSYGYTRRTASLRGLHYVFVSRGFSFSALARFFFFSDEEEKNGFFSIRHCVSRYPSLVKRAGYNFPYSLPKIRRVSSRLFCSEVLQTSSPGTMLRIFSPSPCVSDLLKS